VKLLEFRTFSGAMAFQPCCLNIDFMGLFRALQPMEAQCDHVFEVGRTWSCVLQGINDLPKDLRWVLATIYNFCSHMLSSQSSEDTLWKMRAWLMHWYDVADDLLLLFNIPASAPNVDWFLRPPASPLEETLESEANSFTKFGCGNSTASDANQTVLRHCPQIDESQSPKLGEAQQRLPNHQLDIREWIAAQPEWGVREQPFDHTSEELAALSQQHETSQTTHFQFDPRVSPFDPNQDLWTSHASDSSRASLMSGPSTPALSSVASCDTNEAGELGRMTNLASDSSTRLKPVALFANRRITSRSWT
jgi:hypothetical protein